MNYSPRTLLETLQLFEEIFKSDLLELHIDTMYEL